MIRANREQENSLPAGWCLKRLDEVCEFLDHRRKPINESERRARISGKKESELYPYYGANGQAGWIDDYLFDEPLILLAEDGGAFGSAFKPIAYKVDGKCWVNNHAHVLKPLSIIDFDFCLFAISIRPDVGDLVTGNTRPKLNQAIAASIPMPLPPLDEQRRIAGILKERLADVERARAAAEAQLEAAKGLTHSYLRQAFDENRFPEAPLKVIGDFARLQSGYAFKSEWYTREGIRLLRNANVFQNRIDWSDAVWLPASRRQEFGQFELGVGDIVLTLDRPLVANGLKVARITEHDIPSLLLQRVGRFRLQDGLDAGYLFAFLNSPIFLKHIAGHEQSLGVPHISPKQVEAIPIPIPSVELQRQVAAAFGMLKATSERLKESLQSQFDSIDLLPSSLLNFAFSGKA